MLGIAGHPRAHVRAFARTSSSEVGGMHEKNRSYWNASSDEYQAAHGATLRETALAWGVWRIPESELHVLGRVEGLRVLELGCGAAPWTAALLREGAHAVGMDLSERQLAHAARALSGGGGPAAPLVQGDAERLPFRGDSMDVVFCDHGATTFARPELTVAEAARVLRSGGLLAFCMSSPFHDVCWDQSGDRLGTELVNSYFELSVMEDAESVCHQLPYGAWIRLFRQNSLVVEDLVELQAPEGALTTYSDYASPEWARRWPADHIWKLRKA
jgi:SAM-dependent methyltransferase